MWGWSPGRAAATAPWDGQTWSCPGSVLCHPRLWLQHTFSNESSPFFTGPHHIVSWKGTTGSIPPLLLLLPVPRLSKNKWLPGSLKLHAITQQLGTDLWSRHTNVKWWEANHTKLGSDFLSDKNRQRRYVAARDTCSKAPCEAGSEEHHPAQERGDLQHCVWSLQHPSRGTAGAPRCSLPGGCASSVHPHSALPVTPQGNHSLLPKKVLPICSCHGRKSFWHCCEQGLRRKFRQQHCHAPANAGVTRAEPNPKCGSWIN